MEVRTRPTQVFLHHNVVISRKKGGIFAIFGTAGPRRGTPITLMKTGKYVKYCDETAAPKRRTECNRFPFLRQREFATDRRTVPYSIPSAVSPAVTPFSDAATVTASASGRPLKPMSNRLPDFMAVF